MTTPGVNIETIPKASIPPLQSIIESNSNLVIITIAPLERGVVLLLRNAMSIKENFGGPLKHAIMSDLVSTSRIFTFNISVSWFAVLRETCDKLMLSTTLTGHTEV